MGCLPLLLVSLLFAVACARHHPRLDHPVAKMIPPPQINKTGDGFVSASNYFHFESPDGRITHLEYEVQHPEHVVNPVDFDSIAAFDIIDDMCLAVFDSDNNSSAADIVQFSSQVVEGAVVPIQDGLWGLKSHLRVAILAPSIIQQQGQDARKLQYITCSATPACSTIRNICSTPLNRHRFKLEVWPAETRFLRMSLMLPRNLAGGSVSFMKRHHLCTMLESR